jgi:Amt family ammonium transporter
MSHEIRTPLNGVVGMIDLLRRTSLNESQARFATVARSSADALLSVINDSLDFSKIEAGRLELESVTLDLTNLIENVAESVSVLAAKKGLEIGCNIDGNVPERVVGDPGRLSQIFNNLSNNAIKFTEKGHVVLTASLVGREGPIARVRFTVSDSGIGIPPDRKNRLFQSFSQVDASTTRKYGGTGLGLAICKRLVEMMGGEIGVDSEPGKGSTFWFVIPMAVSLETVPPGNVAATIERLRHLSVLVVDDNPVNREIIERQLSAWDLKVCVASDAPSAISLLTERQLAGTPIDVAVLDWHMPGMDGIELARVIRASPQIGDTTLVMLTSVADNVMGQEIRALGFAGYLVKPVRQSRLLDAVADAAGARYRSAALPNSTAAAGEPSKPVQPRSRAHLLLVEDNEINRMVAGEILRNCGYTFEMAESGAAALVAVFTRTFDLILMDCQMPDMDGFEATRAIRQREISEGEASQSPRHIPIVALTANAIKGDRETCIAAGMDDYVSKPVSAEKLVAAIEGQLHGKCDPQPAATTQEGSPYTARPSSDPVDLAAFLERCMGNKKVATNVLAAFAAQVGKEMANLQRLIAEGSVNKLMKLAHLLKGSAANISAEGVRQAAAELERIGIIGDLAAAAQQAEALQVEVDRCLEFIKRSQPGASAHPPAQMPIT